MSFESQIMSAVQQSMQEAAKAAERSWKTDQTLYGTAMLTGIQQTDSFASSEAELTFETHAQKIPAGTRDAYGVAGKTIAARPRRFGSHASPQTLMQKTAETMESAFTDSLQSHLQQI